MDIKGPAQPKSYLKKKMPHSTLARRGNWRLVGKGLAELGAYAPRLAVTPPFPAQICVKQRSGACLGQCSFAQNGTCLAGNSPQVGIDS